MPSSMPRKTKYQFYTLNEYTKGDNVEVKLMNDDFKPRLTGGIFLALITEAAKPRTGNKQKKQVNLI